MPNPETTLCNCVTGKKTNDPQFPGSSATLACSQQVPPFTATLCRRLRARAHKLLRNQSRVLCTRFIFVARELRSTHWVTRQACRSTGGKSFSEGRTRGGSTGGSRQQLCDILQQLCHILQQLCNILQERRMNRRRQVLL